MMKSFAQVFPDAEAELPVRHPVFTKPIKFKYTQPQVGMFAFLVHDFTLRVDKPSKSASMGIHVKRGVDIVRVRDVDGAKMRLTKIDIINTHYVDERRRQVQDLIR